MANPNHEQVFITDAMIRDVCEKFGRLIKTLGINNSSGIGWQNNQSRRRRPPTDRYRFEVEFAYALNELQRGPYCMRTRLYDELSQVVIRLIEHLKTTPAQAA